MEPTQADRMCFSKTRYTSEIKAAYAVGRICGKYDAHKNIEHRVYPCPICKGFHITTVKNKNRPAIRKLELMSL